MALKMQGKQTFNFQCYYEMGSFMQMFVFAQITLFDQMNIICNTPCHNIVVNTTYYDSRHFAKLVKKNEFKGLGPTYNPRI